MGVVIDTSLFIAAERKRFDMKAFLATECVGEQLYVTTMTVSELLHGWERAPAGKRKTERKRHVEDVIQKFAILDFDVAAARLHAQIWAKLASTGQMINGHDMLIAASCLSLELDIATLDIGDFSRIKGLKSKNVMPYLIA